MKHVLCAFVYEGMNYHTILRKSLVPACAVVSVLMFGSCAIDAPIQNKTVFEGGYIEAIERPTTTGRAFQMRIHIEELERIRAKPASKDEELVRQESEYYYAHQLGRDIWLVNGADSIRPTICHVEQDGGIRPWRTVLLDFDVESKFGDHLTLHSPVTHGKVVKLVL